MAAMGTNEWPPLSSVLCQVHCSPQCQSSWCDVLIVIVYPLVCSLGLPLFLFPLNLACSALCGIWSVVILSTCPNHRSLCWMTLSNRVVWLHSACLMSSFLIFCCLVTTVILHSQLISAARILFLSCFRIVQHSNPIRKIGCVIVSYILIFVLLILCSWSMVVIPNACHVRPILPVCLFHCCYLHLLALLHVDYRLSLSTTNLCN